MLPLGHAATALAGSDLFGGDPRFAGIGSQLPDLVDKPLAWVFRTTESSRFIAHTLIFGLVCTAGVYQIAGPAAGRGFLVGYASHLVGDQLLGGKLPLLWPLKRYRLGHKRFRLKPRPLLIELAAGIYLYNRWRPLYR